MKQFEEYFNCFSSYNASQWGPELTFIVWGEESSFGFTEVIQVEIKLCPVKKKNIYIYIYTHTHTHYCSKV